MGCENSVRATEIVAFAGDDRVFAPYGVVWSGSLAAILLKLLWVRAPKWLSAAIGVALGWVGAVAF